MFYIHSTAELSFGIFESFGIFKFFRIFKNAYITFWNIFKKKSINSLNFSKIFSFSQMLQIHQNFSFVHFFPISRSLAFFRLFISKFFKIFYVFKVFQIIFDFTDFSVFVKFIKFSIFCECFYLTF